MRPASAANRAAEGIPPGNPGAVRVEGKFFYVGDQRLLIKGVTYGPFRPNDDGCEYHDRSMVKQDFAAMAEAGINMVRTYTVPPIWLLDTAREFGLRVMVGLPWEQHVTFLDDRKIKKRIMESVRSGIRACARHPAIFCYAIGNEIPSGIVRWHGKNAVERFLKRLYLIARGEDPDALVTYVSYPSTEYLHLPFIDFQCFNVYLEEPDRLAAYLARLQNIAEEQPLVMAEIGLDSIRNGEDGQAESLLWQVRTTYQSGCAGAFVFSWTDEWHRGGHDIEDWAFGLTRKDRQPKAGLAAVQRAYADPLLPEGSSWPSVSVVICTYNGSRTIRECLDGVTRLDYEGYEVVVVNDGSTDDTASIVDSYGFKQIRIENGGLSNARNVGLYAATGEIIAYIDDDAYPDPGWLKLLAVTFMNSDHAGVGGPNLPPADDGPTADCVANAPGGPSHVLHSDMEAEHLPGCNMAFRRQALLDIEGFDTRFWIAGDDVDLCWRLLKSGKTLGFNPGAMVWHHRRNSVRTYLKQQTNYGKAEGMLEEKWPDKYNRLGHLRWAGRLYGKGHTRTASLHSGRVNFGVWGSRLFQPMYAGNPSTIFSLTMMPEWYLVTLGLAGFSMLGLLWKPMFLALPLLVIAAGVPLVQVCLSARMATFTSDARGLRGRWKLYGLTAALHVLQPLARLLGRMSHKLTPWRRLGSQGRAFPMRRTLIHWSETWKSANDWLRRLESTLKTGRVPIRRGREYDRWDLQATCGLLGAARILSTIEEHGEGKQMIRVNVWPRFTYSARGTIFILGALALAAALSKAWLVSSVLAFITMILLVRGFMECGTAVHSIRQAVKQWAEDDES